jgi:hypothetical protein
MHRGLERLLIRLSNYITNGASSQPLFGKMGNGEWGVGSGNKARFLIPTPHFPFPIPFFQLYLNHLASSGSVGRLPYISMPTR